MNQADRSYYLRRAEAEIDLAQQASNDDAGRIHYQLAAAYLDLVYGDGTAREALEGGRSHVAATHH